MHARRPLFAALIATVVLLAVSGQATATRQWCRKDPVFIVAGTRVTVDVAVPDEDQGRVTDPVVVVLYVPSGVSASLLSTDGGFGGRGEDASVAVSGRLRASSKGIPIAVAVTVPASRNSVLVNVAVTPEKGRSAANNGRANVQISVNANVIATK